MKDRYYLKRLFYNVQYCFSTLIYPFIKCRNCFSSKNQARILMYHSISDFPPESHVPYDNISPELFETHMKILARNNFNLISLNKLIFSMQNEVDLPPNSIAITFDDGYKNNYLYALPILNRMGFSATFFLIAGSIGKDEPFKHLLWDEVSRAFFAARPETRLPLDWEEVNAMQCCGMDIGSHGLTHRSIGYLGREAARMEIFESKQMLEDAISSKIKCFSYPFGSSIYNDFNIHTSEIIGDAGYEGACTTEIGAVAKGDSVYELRRIPIRETDNSDAFKQKIFGAYDWVGVWKRVFQRNMKRVDRVM